MITKAEKAKLIEQFGSDSKNTGSTAVQIALLTTRIDGLQKHMQINKKDFSTQRGLMQLVNNRKQLLIYLQKTSEAEYKDVIKRLGIRK